MLYNHGLMFGAEKLVQVTLKRRLERLSGDIRITLIEGDDNVNPMKTFSVPREQKVRRSLGKKNVVYFRNRKKACMDGKKEKELKG